jgi:molybdopterin converting factor small subunit
VDEPTVTVELLGLARHRAGQADVVVRGRTVADVVRAVQAACPTLGELLDRDGRLSRRYLFSIDGEAFLADAGMVLPADCRFLILGADAGG